MGVICLSNLSSHTKSNITLAQLGVLKLIIKVSFAYKENIQIQQACIGCLGWFYFSFFSILLLVFLL